MDNNGGLRLNAILSRLDGLYAKILSDERPSAVGFLTLLDSWRKEVLRAEKNFAALQENLGKTPVSSEPAPSELSRQFEFVQNQARDLEAAFERQREEAEALQRVLEAKESELDSLRFKQDDELASVPEIKRQAASSERAAKRAEAAHERQALEIAALRKELEAKEAELDAWQSRCEACMSDVPELRKQASLVEKMTKRSEAELARQKERIESLSRALESKDEELAILRERRDKDAERIFDLERRLAEPAKAPAPPPPAPPQKPLIPAKPEVVEKKPIQKAPPPKPPEKPAVTAAPAPPPKAPSSAEHRAALNAYDGLVSLFKETSGGLAALRGPLSGALSACLDIFEADPGPLLAQTGRSSQAAYLWAHSANVALLSMHAARILRLDKETAQQVGLCGALHELRLLSLEETSAASEADREHALNPLEPKLIAPHLARIEKTLGHSFPKSAEARFAAHAIALCDLYEALSHPRPWREPLLPHDAVMAIAREFSKEFDRRVLQAFIAGVTLYPPGSWVELSNGEAGRVVSVSSRTPTLPTVEIRLDSEGKPVEQAVLLDLAKSPIIHISKAADETKLGLEAERWWP